MATKQSNLDPDIYAAARVEHLQLAIGQELRLILHGVPNPDAAADNLKIAAIIAEQIRRSMARLGVDC